MLLRKLSLSTQFLIAAALVLFVAMAVLGTWMNEQIKHSVLVTSGAQGANFMHGFLEPRVQELVDRDLLRGSTHRELDELFIGTALGNTVVSIKIWTVDGIVLYSTTKDLIGSQFVSTDVERASRGEIVAEYEDLISQESAHEQTLDMALIEVYAPLYKTGTNEVLAVGEIYENANALAAELRTSRITTWALVCLTTLLMLAVLYAIVRRGTATIARQRAELGQHIFAARRLAGQNEQLRLVADKARRDASEANEQLLGRIGSDIHDGPIQLLTLAVFKLTRTPRGGRQKIPAREQAESAGVAVALTRDALTELRNISSGLSLPDVDELNLREALELAVFRHEDTTGTSVVVDLKELPDQVSEALKICAYRVVQEALNNAYKHAKGAEKHVRAWSDAETVYVAVTDAGPGLENAQSFEQGPPKLGLAGIRNRVEALRGKVEISSDRSGTRVSVAIPLES